MKELNAKLSHLIEEFHPINFNDVYDIPMDIQGEIKEEGGEENEGRNGTKADTNVIRDQKAGVEKSDDEDEIIIIGEKKEGQFLKEESFSLEEERQFEQSNVNGWIH